MPTPTLPTFDHIIFDASNHTYSADGKPLIGVTTLIKELQSPFDADYWAARKAAERGVDESVIRAEWKAKADNGKARGTRVHEFIHRTLTKQALEDPRVTQNRIGEERAFEEFLRDMDEKQLFAPAPLGLEYVIGDVELGIAGTVDALFADVANGSVYLYDWKTGGKFNTSNRFQKLLPPFGGLDDCELNYYSLQLALYHLILHRAGLKTLWKSAYIVYLSGDGTYQVHATAPHLPMQIEAWLMQRQAKEQA